MDGLVVPRGRQHHQSRRRRGAGARAGLSRRSVDLREPHEPRAPSARGARRTASPPRPARLGDGLIALGNKSVGALFWGVDAAARARRLHARAARRRRPVSARRDRRQIVLGRQLARSLDARVGSEVVRRRPGGGRIARQRSVHRRRHPAEQPTRKSTARALMHAADFADLFVSGDRVQEIALNSNGRLPLDALAARCGAAAPRADVRTWRELLPTFSDMVDAVRRVHLDLRPGVRPCRRSRRDEHDADGDTRARPRVRARSKRSAARRRGIVRDVAVEAFGAGGRVDGRSASALGSWASLYLQRTGIDTSRWAGTLLDRRRRLRSRLARPSSRRAASSCPVIVMLAAAVLPSLYPAAIAARLDPVAP